MDHWINNNCRKDNNVMSEENSVQCSTPPTQMFVSNETVGSLHESPVASSCAIVLLGKVGSGKSATGNTILKRKNYFLSKKRSKAVTTKISKGAVNVNGRELVVYDTPGFCDPDCSDEVIHEKIKTVIDETSSNPRVFLLVVKIDRFTAEEQSVVREVESILGSTLLENTIILFTRGDELEDQSIEEFIGGDDNDLTIMMEKYGTRYHVFNNKMNDAEQVKSLVDKIGHFCQTPNPSCGPRIKPQTPPKRRLILIGKTGVGKSATGNTILGFDHFKSKQCIASVTQRTQVGHGVVCDRDVCVVDTPGLFDSMLTVDKLAEEFAESIMSCAPGPHAFLIVMPINNRFTKHEKEAIDILEKLFGQEMAKHAILVFTYGDLLEKGNSVDKMIAQSPDLSRLVKHCGGRYQLINNNNRCQNNIHQVKELMGKIDKMLEMNGGSYYTNEMFIQAVEVAKEDQESLKMQADEKQRSLEQHHQNELDKVKREAEQQNTIDQEKLLQRIHELEHLKLEMEKKQEEEHRSQNQPNVQRENEERLEVQEAHDQNPSNDPNPDSANTHRKKWLTPRIRRILISLGIGLVVGAAAVGLAAAVGVAVVGAGVSVGVVAGLGALGGAVGGAGLGAVIGRFTGKDPKKDN